MRGHLGSAMSTLRSRNLTGWHLTGISLSLVILLAVGLVLAWGDTLPYPKVLDKEIPTELVSLSTEIQGDLESGVISSDLRRAFSDEGASLSDRSTVETVDEGRKWLITAPSQLFIVVKEGSSLNIGDGLLNVSSSQFQGALAKGIIPENLREGFRLKDGGLSGSAKASTVEEGRSWLITDPGSKYAVTVGVQR